MRAASLVLWHPTKRSLLLVAFAVGTANFGCCLCDNPFDQQYAAFGGRNPRVDMVNGRVGSAFQDAAAAVMDEPFDPQSFDADGMIDEFDSSVPYSEDRPFQLEEPLPNGEQSLDRQPYEVVPFERIPSSPEPGSTQPQPVEPRTEAELPDYESYDGNLLPDLNLEEPAPAESFGQPTPAEPFQPTPLEPETLTPPDGSDATDEPSSSDLDF